MRRRHLLKPLAWSFAFLLAGGGLAAWWANQHRAELFERVQALINEELNGSFQASGVSATIWSGTPGIILKLHDVRLRDRRFDRHRIDLLSADEVRIRLSLRELLQQRVVISRITLADARVRAFVGRDGYTNLSVFQTKAPAVPRLTTTPRSTILQYLGRVHLENTAVAFIDSLHDKHHAGTFRAASLRLNSTDSSEALRLEGTVQFDGLTFSSQKGPFLTQRATKLDLHLDYHRARRELRVRPSTVQLDGSDRIELAGRCFFPLDQAPVIDLTFRAQGMRLSRVLPLLTPYLEKRIGRFGFDTVLKTAQARLRGSTGPGIVPTVDVRFETDTLTFPSRIGPLTQVRATGGFTNRLRPQSPANEVNSRLYFTALRGFWEDLPFAAQLRIDNLLQPIADLRGLTQVDLADLNDLTEPVTYRFDEGQARLTYQFRGNLQQPFDTLTGRLNGTLRGELRVSKGLFTYLPRQLELSGLEARASFDGSDLRLHQFTAAANRNPVQLTGIVREFIPFLTLPRGKLQAAAELYSARLDLNTVPIRPTSRRARHNRPAVARRQLQRTISRVLDRLEMTLGVRLGQFRYRRFQASQIRGLLVTTQRDVRIRELSMQAFRGKFRLTGQLDYLSRTRNRLDIACRIEGADVKQVFRSFDNFGQQTLTDRHLSGRLTSTATFRTDLTNNYRLLPPTMSGQLYVKLTDGVIQEFAPLKRVQKFVFKRRNFDHVRFATIENDFRLRGEELEIDRMAIESSVLTLYVGGVYSFGTKTDLTVQIPLSNLKHRGTDYELADVDSLRTRGLSVYLRAREEAGEMKIRYEFIHQRKPKDRPRRRRRAERLEVRGETPQPARELLEKP